MSGPCGSGAPRYSRAEARRRAHGDRLPRATARASDVAELGAAELGAVPRDAVPRDAAALGGAGGEGSQL